MILVGPATSRKIPRVVISYDCPLQRISPSYMAVENCQYFPEFAQESHNCSMMYLAEYLAEHLLDWIDVSVMDNSSLQRVPVSKWVGLVPHLARISEIELDLAA